MDNYRNGIQYDKTEGHLPNGTYIKNRYQIQELIGLGGFCFTYRAFDSVLGMEVCLKEYYPHTIAHRDGSNTVEVFTERNEAIFEQGKNRFLREARGLAKFYSNPGIVSIFDFFEELGTAFIVMEFLKGENLRQTLKRTNGPLPIDQVYKIAAAICSALAAVHKEGIVHRDISPDNIFCCESGQIKLIDFGALNKQNSETLDTVTIIVKQGYAPVEQYYRDGIQGPWTDIYALGATLYHISTGKGPQESVSRLNRDMMVPPHIINPRIPLKFSKAIMCALAIHKENRFQNAAAFARGMFAQSELDRYNRSQVLKARDAQQIMPQRRGYVNTKPAANVAPQPTVPNRNMSNAIPNRDYGGKNTNSNDKVKTQIYIIITVGVSLILVSLLTALLVMAI